MNERQDLWKNSVDKKFIINLAEYISQVYSAFEKQKFIKQVLNDDFFERELKDRLNTIAKNLKDFLPANYKQATNILIKAAPLAGEFANWSLTSYVEQFGQNQFEQSVRVLKALTEFGTSEFGIRPFVNQKPEKMIEIFCNWATDKNYHIRRLAAEGSRPRGVWVAHIPEYKKDPKGVLSILELLKEDDSLYVRKAVANNLNDISKDNPDIVIKTAKRWLKKNKTYTNWIVKHGCRTLIKQGNPEVLKLLGYAADPNIKLVSFKVSPKNIKIGEKINFELRIKSESQKEINLMIDYVVGYTKASGKISSKVFKLTKLIIKPGETIKLTRHHKFADLSTRKHFPGIHSIGLLINGDSVKPLKFNLTA